MYKLNHFYIFIYSLIIKTCKLANNHITKNVEQKSYLDNNYLLSYQDFKNQKLKKIKNYPKEDPLKNIYLSKLNA